MEFEISSLEGKIFRVKEMNAIEVLALQSQMSFENTEKAEQLINTILEKVECKVEKTANWLPVKEKGRKIYFPEGIENNPVAINEIVVAFVQDYLQPLFQKSEPSNGEQ